ncbi:MULTISPECIES: 30S ribosomal protein S14 [Haloferax]|mgnify:FL=1|jgi:small subunit ribosomal protein S14|uniref:Small ribosomal subunit protein uS14 n=16 Tax=Haloferax TaxID=2251 RepID=D4GTY2_HALVD|nr:MULTISPECIES: 30S ribosomal protein S14 [Haloferax]ADE04149.1 30S ribosomal protein S14 [Haloferax volcanii DS2]AFK20255.1 30S ribosomal protein S14P [Haloferax mediterranei ATCC 33500]AHZ23625.1 30S ribosomal protein S14 [Haloferax mediterranei ATCC 33500]AKU08565.1 30S ribosomal protein S14 [Haloferax gibbonsii]ELK55471.1 30S ribosomal protein S14P [Haloferax sp. BAB-2207]
MSDSETEQTGEHASRRTGQENECRRCGRKQGLVSKYDINLCRQCFREIAREMGFKKYR